MNNELREKILETACDLCHWPYVYRDDQIMADERCAFCPMEKLLKEAVE